MKTDEQLARLHAIRASLRRTRANEIAVCRKTGSARGIGLGSKERWSQREDRVLMRTDITIAEMASLTGRTYKAVIQRRSRDPKFRLHVDRNLRRRTAKEAK